MGQATTLIVINIAFSFAVPNISIGGHLGGLAAGVLGAIAFVSFRQYYPAVGRPALVRGAVVVLTRRDRGRDRLHPRQEPQLVAGIRRLGGYPGRMAARGRFVFALVLASSLLRRGARSRCPGAPASRTLYVDGDSLAVGTGWYLSTYLPGWTMHGTLAVSRHASQGVRSIEERAREGLLERVVVVDLGTNDDPGAVSRFAGYVRDVVRAAGPSRCVVWSTINRPPYGGVSYSGYNAALKAARRALPQPARLRLGRPRSGSPGVVRLRRSAPEHARLQGPRSRPRPRDQELLSRPADRAGEPAGLSRASSSSSGRSAR